MLFFQVNGYGLKDAAIPKSLKRPH